MQVLLSGDKNQIKNLYGVKNAKDSRSLKMSIEIDCPDCEGSGGNKHFPCTDCGRTGKITVYTETELKAEIEEHDKRAYDTLSILGVPKERAISVANGIEVLSTRYRKEQAGYEYNKKQAVKEEREECALICDNLQMDYWDDSTGKECGEVIRARSE